MALKYFSKLPIIEYPFSKQRDKKARDILHRIFFDQKFLNKSEYVRQYSVEDGDRPEIISYRLYQRSDLYTVIMMLNELDLTMLSGLPMGSATYNEYLEEKYSEDVYYLIPMESSNFLDYVGTTGASSGISGGYVYPMFARGFGYGDKIFKAGNDGFQDYQTRAYVKEWNPILSSFKLDVLSGSFNEGMTITNESSSAYYVISHVKAGKKALHHFEAKMTLIKDTNPIVKGQIVDPLSRVDVRTSSGITGLAITPMGIYPKKYASGDQAATAGYASCLAYQYNKNKGRLPLHIQPYIAAISNEEYEANIQERKRNISVPTQERAKLGELIFAVSDILDDIK